ITPSKDYIPNIKLNIDNSISINTSLERKLHPKINADIHFDKNSVDNQNKVNGFKDDYSARQKQSKPKAFEDINGINVHSGLTTSNINTFIKRLKAKKYNYNELKDITREIATFSDEMTAQGIKGFEEGEKYRVALHEKTGRLLAGEGGAKGAKAVAEAAPTLNKIESWIPGSFLKSIFNAIAPKVVGFFAGGFDGAKAATLIDENNRQLNHQALSVIRTNTRRYAKKRGISEKEAIKELTSEGLRGVSDDFAEIEKNKTAREFLNKLQQEQKNGKLFAVLDRDSDEYKNSLINSQYVDKNKELYDSVTLGNYEESTSDILLAHAIQESSAYHKQVGKKNTESVYSDILNRVHNYQQASNLLNRGNNNDDDFKLADRYESKSLYLKNKLSANYTHATGLLSWKEKYANDNPISKVMWGNIAEGYVGVSVGKMAKNLTRKVSNGEAVVDNSSLRARVEANIAKSRAARKSSKFSQFVKKENELLSRGKKVKLFVGDNVVRNIITGPRGGRATGTGVFDVETKAEIFKRESGGYFVINSDGKQVKVKSPFGNSNKSKILQNNRINGADFEEAYKKRLEKNEENVQQQVTLKTSSGIKTRIDFISKGKTGEVKCIECKSSQTAPLTKNQRKAFSEIEKSGATVIGKGKDGFDSGTIIPPTKIEIVRPK
ncbi:hypothetical protein QJU32_09600, partial [Pasteurella atlantica]